MQLCSKRPLGLRSSSTLLQHNRVHLLKPCCSRLHRVAIASSSNAIVPSYNDQPNQRGNLQRVAGAVGDYPYSPSPTAADYPYNPQSFGNPESTATLGEAARQSLGKATRAMSRYGWIGFWTQLSLSVISGVILLFSVAFTSQSGPKSSLYLTLVGILAGFLSTFWNFSYQRTANRMQEYLDGANVARIKKQQVMDLITRGILINIVGMGSTLIGISTLVGLLVAKTLGNASINPFIAGTAAGYNPVLALDVFLVQAATNTLLGHFLSLICSLWLLNVVGEGRGLRFQRKQHMTRIRQSDGSSGSLIGGTVKGFAGVYDIPKTLGGRGGGGRSGTRGGGESWRVRAAAAAAAAQGAAAGVGSTGGRPVLAMGSSTATAGVSSSSSSRVSSGMPVVAAAAVSQPEFAAAESSLAPSSAAAAEQPSLGFAAAGPATAQGSVGDSVYGSISSEPAAGFAGFRDSYTLWKAAARPAAAAAAATAQALEAAGLPAPPVRPPKTPQQRLEQDMLIFPTVESLQYLTGEIPGDQGFDPLHLFNPEISGGFMNRRWLVTSEVIHGRWAMLGVVGCLVPEILGGKPWFQTGWLPPAGSVQYWTDTYTLFAIQLGLMGFAEGCRLQDYRKPGSMAEPLQVLLPHGSDLEGGFAGSGSPAYPGGPVFNYFDYVRDIGPAAAQYKESEIRHGRLAMLAMLGFGAQAVATGEGPWANFLHHIESPGGANILTSFGDMVVGEEHNELGLKVAEAAAATAAGAAVLGMSLLAA